MEVMMLFLGNDVIHRPILKAKKIQLSPGCQHRFMTSGQESFSVCNKTVYREAHGYLCKEHYELDRAKGRKSKIPKEGTPEFQEHLERETVAFAIRQDWLAIHGS